MATWRFILTDSTFTPVGEILNASERKITLPLNKVPTAAFKVRLDHPLADTLLTTNCYLKAYRTIAGGTPSLEYYGPIVSAEENIDSNGQSIAVNSAGAAWVLSKRLTGKSSTGTTVTNDRAVLARLAISGTNNDGETHIDWAGTYTSGSSFTYTFGPYKTVLDTINELGNTIDGFDWRIDPIENFANGQVTGNKIGMFNAATVFGSEQDEALFEYGTGRANIAAYKRSVSRDTQANKVYHNADTGADSPGYPTKFSSDADSIATWGLMEDVAQGSLQDNVMRQKLVDEHVLVRKNPRQLIEFTPHIDPNDSGRLPVFRRDYYIGDTVHARAFYNGQQRFDVLPRVWVVTFDLSAEGTEQLTLTLADE